MSKHKDLIFIIVGALLLLITISIVVYSINFLVENAGTALDQDSTKSREIVRFNLEGLNKLGITK